MAEEGAAGYRDGTIRQSRVQGYWNLWQTLAVPCTIVDGKLSDSTCVMHWFSVGRDGGGWGMGSGEGGLRRTLFVER